MKKRLATKWIIVIVIAAVVAFGAVGGGVAYAIWTARPENSAWFEMGVDNDNASLKYQIFVPIDAEGNRVAGAHDVSESMGYARGNYVLSDHSTPIVSLALVGWEGGISLDYVVIPDTAKVIIDGEERELPVTKVMVDSDYRDYYFRGNSVLTSIYFGRNVTYVAKGVFAAMERLSKTYVLGDGEDEKIVFEKDSFLACPRWDGITSEQGREYEIGE